MLYANVSELVREALRRMEQADLLAEQTAIADPDHVVVQIRKGIESVAKGDHIELKGDRELRDFFSDVIQRGIRRLGTKRRVARR